MTADHDTQIVNEQKGLQCLTTEHFTLQGAKNATITEANGRTSIFLGTVSSSVVALAFVGQVSGMNQVFFAFALILLPCLFFIGVATFTRVVQTAIEDVIYTRGINRIRHFYVEVVPQIRNYFVLSIYDDISGFRTPGSHPSRWQPLLSMSGMIAILNSVIGAVFIGLLALMLLQQSILNSIGIGIVVLLGILILHLIYQNRAGQRVSQMVPARFHSPTTENISKIK